MDLISNVTLSTLGHTSRYMTVAGTHIKCTQVCLLTVGTSDRCKELEQCFIYTEHKVLKTAGRPGGITQNLM